MDFDFRAFASKLVKQRGQKSAVQAAPLCSLNVGGNCSGNEEETTRKTNFPPFSLTGLPMRRVDKVCKENQDQGDSGDNRAFERHHLL